jgi:hypothetical protein
MVQPENPQIALPGPSTASSIPSISQPKDPNYLHNIGLWDYVSLLNALLFLSYNTLHKVRSITDQNFLLLLLV